MMGPEEQRASSDPLEGQVPEERFSDVFWANVNPWSCIITYGLRKAHPSEKDKPSVRVRMPLQQGKALAIILLRSIRQYEQQSGADVDLPRQVLQSLAIPPEDWERFKGI